MDAPIIIDHLGEERKLGNIAPRGGLMRAWPLYGEPGVTETPMFPRSLWDDKIRSTFEDPFTPYIHDQDGIGQCNADATTAAMEACRATQGLPPVQLSAADLYGRINGGADNGSTLEDGLQEAMAHGVGTAATSGTIWRRNMRYASPAERQKYRVISAFLCPTFDHCFSAVIAGFKLISGVVWYGNYTPTSDGWLPNPRGSSVGGHAIFGYVPMKRGSQYGIGHDNSWTPRWGYGGRFVLPEVSYGDGAIGGWWAVRQVTDEGGVLPPQQ